MDSLDPPFMAPPQSPSTSSPLSQDVIDINVDVWKIFRKDINLHQVYNLDCFRVHLLSGIYKIRNELQEQSKDLAVVTNGLAI